MKKSDSIEKNKPFVLDLTEKFSKQLMKFDNSIDKIVEFYKKFGYNKVPYDGIKRWGLDSSTDSSDITYGDIEVGYLLFWRKYSENRFRWVKIKITHKFNGIIFFETIGKKKNKKSYIDTGANDFSWNGDNKSRYTLPKHTFYPMEVVKPKWVDIESWHAPSKMKISNI